MPQTPEERRARKHVDNADHKEAIAAYNRSYTTAHLVPLAKGGTHTFSNVVPACQSCNSKKGTGAPLVPVQPLLLTIAASRSA